MSGIARQTAGAPEWRATMLLGLVVLLPFASAALICWALWTSRAAALEQATVHAADLLRGVRETLAERIALDDSYLREAAAGAALPELGRLPEPVQRELVFGVADAPARGELIVTDAAGHVRFDSAAVPAPEREVAAALSAAVRAQRGGGLAVTEVAADALFARALPADGGMALEIVPMAALRDLLGQVVPAAGVSVALIGEQTQVLLALGDPAPEAALRGTDDDGVSVLRAPIEGTPWVAVLATPFDAIYRGWRREASVVAGVTALTSLCLLVLAVVLHRELRHRRRAQLEADATAARFRLLAENVSDVIMRVRLDGTRLYTSPSVADVIGYTPEELEGTRWTAVVHPEDREIVEGALAEMRGGAERSSALYRCIRKDGADAWIEARLRLLRNPHTGEPAELIALARDVTWQQQAEQELERLARSDALTGIANRRQFDEALEAEWRRAARTDAPLSLLMIDVDRFKAFNDRYGHPAGDEALRQVARAITGHVRRASDTAARYGGEEFAVLLPGLDCAAAQAVAEAIRGAVEALGIPHEGSPHGRLTISAGVATAAVLRGGEPGALVTAADKALYAAKLKDRNRIEAFEGAVGA